MRSFTMSFSSGLVAVAEGTLRNALLEGPIPTLLPVPFRHGDEFCPTPEFPPRSLIAQRYEVESELGSGGMGVVVAARDTKLGHRVAIKMLHPQGLERPDLVARFHREARAAAALQSDHAARVLDSGVDSDGRPYTVMELLEGEDLADALIRRGPFQFAEAALVIMQACDAIGEAHDKGIVHRDLKPANLFLARRPSGAVVVKVLDFGISKSSESLPGAVTLTGGSSLLGSPVYMSPEQLRSAQHVDPRTDIYSLAVTLYELLVGRPPFYSDAVPELCAMILKDDPLPPSLLREGLPPALEAVVLRGLARDREHRFASAQEFAEALRPFVVESSRLSAAPHPLRISLRPVAASEDLEKAEPGAEAMATADDVSAATMRAPSVPPIAVVRVPREALEQVQGSGPADGSIAPSSVSPRVASGEGVAGVSVSPVPLAVRRPWATWLVGAMAAAGLLIAGWSERVTGVAGRSEAAASAQPMVRLASAPVVEVLVAPAEVVPIVEPTVEPVVAVSVALPAQALVRGGAPRRGPGTAAVGSTTRPEAKVGAEDKARPEAAEVPPVAPRRRNPLDLKLQ